jgi:aspartyl-tRNA(Asn)/glutamyl-tRNA(Gln) amidotransferase subunit A
MTNLHDLSVAETARRIRSREVSPVDLIEHMLDRIERSQPTLKAFVTVDADGARAAARAAASLASGADLGPLHGVPFAAKDIYDAAGLPTSAGYRPLADVPAVADCFSVAKLKAAGAILVGKAVTTQFASSDPSPSVNPWRADRTPAGSSSGSGVGVAARLVPLALGTQTGGSILRPAAYNGVVGLKPTYGRVSRQGIVPLSWSLDHAGPIVRTVEDAALVLGVIAGHDPRDPQSLAADVPDYVAAMSSSPVSPPRLGLLLDFLDRAEPEVRGHLEGVADRFRAAGATVTEIRLPSSFDLYLAVHGITMQAEAADVHATWIARDRSAYSPRIRAAAMLGQVLPAWAYLHAQRLRRRLRAETGPLLADLDAFLLPTASNLPPGPETTGDASFQAPWSLLGWPSISLPSGMSEAGLPFATQFVGRHLDEPTLFRVAAWAEQIFDFQARPPEYW